MTKRIIVHGDSEQIIKQVQGTYQTKNPRMSSYRNVVLDLLEKFSEFMFSVIPGVRNTVPDSLAVAASVSKILGFLKTKDEFEVTNRPSVPDNIKNWQVFEDDKQIENSLQLEGEFQNLGIDEDNQTEVKDDAIEKTKVLKKTLAGHDIMQLKHNYIPRGFFPLE